MPKKDFITNLMEATGFHGFSDLEDDEMPASNNSQDERLRDLEYLYEAIKELPWGMSIALPWCIESFPKVKEALDKLETKQLKSYLEDAQD